MTPGGDKLRLRRLSCVSSTDIADLGRVHVLLLIMDRVSLHADAPLHHVDVKDEGMHESEGDGNSIPPLCIRGRKLSVFGTIRFGSRELLGVLPFPKKAVGDGQLFVELKSFASTAIGGAADGSVN